MKIKGISVVFSTASHPPLAPDQMHESRARARSRARSQAADRKAFTLEFDNISGRPQRLHFGGFDPISSQRAVRNVSRVKESTNNGSQYEETITVFGVRSFARRL
jgi:hypothetical protein